jgi:hypothetical protein
MLVPVSSVSRSDDVSASVVDFFVIRKPFMEKPAGEESLRRREQNLTRERVCVGVIGWVPGLSQCGAAHNQDGDQALGEKRCETQQFACGEEVACEGRGQCEGYWRS